MKHSVGGFDVDDFIGKLVTFMGGQEAGAVGADDEDDEDGTVGDGLLRWEKMGYLALRKSRRVSGFNCM